MTMTTEQVQEWLVKWIRTNTRLKKFTPRGANASSATWAKAAKAFAEWYAFYQAESGQ